MNVIERARASGKCPPSLFRDEPKEDSFETAVAKVLDANDLVLSSGGSFTEDFKALMQMADSASDVPGDKDTQNAILAQRRCIILAIVGATPSSNSSMALILQSGFLSSVKSWLDDILNGTVGGVDLLLHLLSNIIELPVTKSVVKESGLGKAIGSIDKHKICVDSPNAAAVTERVTKIKRAWNKSVKALNEQEAPAPKRELEPSQLDSLPVAKKARTDEKKPSSFSTLLKKVKPESDRASSAKDAAKSSSPGSSAETEIAGNVGGVKNEKKKQSSKRVKWQDHFGGDLSERRMIEGNEVKSEEKNVEDDSSVSWSDRRKRDRLREKELLSKVKKSKLMDDDDDDMGMDALSTPQSRTISRTIPTTTAWKAPSLLPARADAPPPQVNSPEVATQTARMATVPEAHYLSEYSVPSSPAPMSDVEQALDMTNQSSTVTQTIPFFVPQLVPTPAPAAPMPAPMVAYPPPANTWAPAPPQPAGLPMQITASAATPDFVQSLGLPMFLVGQDTQALQTLASTPSLLSTFVDSNGMYDQARLTSLVQTLSQNSQPTPHPSAATGHMGTGGYQQSIGYSQTGQNGYSGPPSGGGGIYGPASGGTYGPASATYGGGWQGGGSSSGFREQKSNDGNLHVSGYGPMTTQMDIINMFAPYVQVDEVVMKGTFSFVNTSDPPGAARARDALTGALLGGQPIRINTASRKKRDDVPPPFGGGSMASVYGGGGQSVPGLVNNPPMINQGGFPPVVPPGIPPGIPPGVPPPQAGNVDVSHVRDDRGNPATKNLFVAGYGQGTSEFQLRELFGQYAQIVGIITKGTFSFVNTSDRVAAVRAREALGGTMVNGGVLRINFAKESGRLGTSFDVTYNSAGGSGGGGGLSHYGRR